MGSNNPETENFSDPKGRRHFLWQCVGAVGLLALGHFINNLPLTAALEEPTLSLLPAAAQKASSVYQTIYQPFKIGLNNAHLLDEYLPGVIIRLALDREFFDRNSKKKDPFYGQLKRLAEWRQRGSNITLIMEIHPEDNSSKLAGMFDTAHELVRLKGGDSVVLGNELNIRWKGYPPNVYARQASFLRDYIKSTAPQTEIGLAGEAWDGAGEFLSSYLNRLNTTFNFLTIHYYGLPQYLPNWVALNRRILNNAGFSDMPISIGETGVSDNAYQGNPYGFLQAKQEDQAQAILKTFCFAKAAGCSINWYSAIDTSANGKSTERFGLLNDKKEPRLAYRFFKEAVGLFHQPSRITRVYRSGYYVFIVEGGDFRKEISWAYPNPNSLGGQVRITTKFSGVTQDLIPKSNFPLGHIEVPSASLTSSEF